MYEPKPCMYSSAGPFPRVSLRESTRSPPNPSSPLAPRIITSAAVYILFHPYASGQLGEEDGVKVAPPRTVLPSCLDPSSAALAVTEGLVTMHEIDIAIMEPRALQIDNTGSDVDSVSGYPSLPFATAQPGQNNGSLIHVCISVWSGGDLTLSMRFLGLFKSSFLCCCLSAELLENADLPSFIFFLF